MGSVPRYLAERVSQASDRAEGCRRSDAHRAWLLLATAVALLVTLGVIVSTAGHGRDGLATETAGAQQRAHASPARPVLYRIVGCRSSGTAAHRDGPPRKWVAIGFDDGPWSDTPAFVSMLEHSHAKATFFMIGRQVTSEFRSTMLRELHDGDALGDHTFTHPDLTRVTDVQGELRSTISAISSLSGYTPCVFRPPYGDYDTSVLRIARSLGLSTILWNVDPADYTLPGRVAIEQRVLAQVRPGSIVISHDGGGPRGQTLAAYPGIIRKLHRRGYRIVTVPEMLGYRPEYERCVKLCDGIGVPLRKLPHDAILLRSP
jgi:peptidoglycan/xylan/chitin deacetylase (PgdA/CDA1 family)